MTKHRLPLLLVVLATCLLAVGGCAADSPTAPEPSTRPRQQQQGQPDDLYGEITEAKYTSWERAPGYDTRRPAKGPHGDETQIFLSPSAEAALAAGATQWPSGAVIVKDVFQNGVRVQIAAMKKTDDGWYWGEWDTQGKPIVEGLAAEPCQSCHSKGTDGTLAVELE